MMAVGEADNGGIALHTETSDIVPTPSSPARNDDDPANFSSTVFQNKAGGADCDRPCQRRPVRMQCETVYPAPLRYPMTILAAALVASI